MKDLEKNKIIASIVLTFLIVSVSVNLIDLLYKPIKVVDSMFQNDGDISVPEGTSGAVTQEQKLDIVTLLTNASAEAGKKVFAKCVSCHNIAKGSPNKVGPSLWNVVGNDKATVSSFPYSKAMLAKGGVWDYDALFVYLNKPQAYVKGTRMAFVGIKNYEQIADLILYMRDYSDKPYPLPDAQ
ncbi:cytochrome c family protein [Anaplasmataceae bacterium AB001_6]|nr:cytochrome c family protein [Anaplasmataceae bacterium AB001_6]